MTRIVKSARGEDRISGLSRLMGLTGSKQAKAEEGDTLAFGRLDHIATGESLATPRTAPQPPAAAAAAPPPAHSLALVSRIARTK